MFEFTQGFSEADHNLAHLQQGGLGLSGRDDYLDQTPDKIDLRAKYRALVASVLHTIGNAEPDAQAGQILALETAIARAHATQADTDDVFKDNNVWLRSDFQTRAPGIDWTTYFAAAGLDAQREFVVWQPSAVVGISRLVASEPLDVWKAYLVFHLLKHYAPELPADIRDLFVAFNGQSAMEPDQSNARALALTQDQFGEVIGQLYVARYFPSQAELAANAMLENIRTAFRARLARLTWMSPETRAKAVAKLDALSVGFGYPDRWTDFSALQIVRGDAFGNVWRTEAFTYRQALAELKQPVDPGQWSLTPQSVNALINFFPNALQFSAGLLQPPYFDYAGDAAANYGSAGAGIAHEISHSFDGLGNIYGVNGQLKLWWSTTDTEQFATAAAPLATQFSAYCARFVRPRRSGLARKRRRPRRTDGRL